MGTWVLVAHGSEAKIIDVKNNGQEISRIKDFSHPETAMKNSEIYSDRQGQTFESASPVRHSKGYDEEPVDHERRVLAKEIACFIEAGFAHNKFERLIIVSSPSMLGALRKALADAVKKTLVHELDKDLMSLDISDSELIDKIRDDLQLVRI